MFSFVVGLGVVQLVAATSAYHDIFSTSPICTATRVADMCLRTQSTLEEARDGSDSLLFRYESWMQVGACQNLNGDNFCAFSNPFFNRGQGISVITTPESIAKIASRTVFKNAVITENSPIPPESPVPYHVAEFPGKGFGLVATRSLRDGELVMSRTPAVMANAKTVNGLGKYHLADLLRNGVESLSSEHKSQYLNLSTHDEAATYEEKVYKIFKTNSFRTGAHDGESDFHSTFTEVSRLNHDCRPNCAYYFDHTTFAHKVIAVRDIAPGEELTISYYDPLQPSSERRQRLSRDWGFACSCRSCTAGTQQIAESDKRIEEVHQLWKELDDYTSNSKATPEKAERLVQLYKQEGIYGRLHEAYYRAAVEWIGVGNAGKAAEHASRCIDRGRTFRGPDRPFIKNMEKLIVDPAGYPGWKFRLKS
ncbi:hypothetical protein DL766_000568 [Monosporascus sp. MC13-8B]|uniref:SET domain-containing protein n=1 Tax=Monosporascus cannonballus TaxID=155416 RepID=A0ABY0GQF7_9PEZI|nr:hypothetical protein DL762_010386 [Monosporascus cannonballus]RYO99522.1 hypothetical protein DL763_001433 [Monosporascus cannonballus]RYP39112.1 hypothetical protein DL766_000568 [Monosporascus sp. MC13-8B]